ncbi:MAG: nucleotidyltransferase family protein [Bryobacterales bacterium]|nr:nucleotidyltransferase family protein [Bryobacterales bacterium]
MNPAAVILAAGESRRMGRVKALLPYRGGTILSELIGAFAAVATPVIVVTGYHGEVIGPHAEGCGAQVAHNAHPERGMLSSLQTGLAALPASADAFFFTPVDYPAIQGATIAALAALLRGQPEAMAAIPRMEGRRGHPVLCRREVAARFLALPESGQAKDVIHDLVPRTAYLDCADSGILMDVDDPAAYDRLLATL